MVVEIAAQLKHFMTSSNDKGQDYNIQLGYPESNLEITSFHKLEKFAPGLIDEKMLVNTADGKLYIIGLGAEGKFSGP